MTKRRGYSRKVEVAASVGVFVALAGFILLAFGIGNYIFSGWGQ